MALQLRRTKTNWSACWQIAVQGGGLVVSKALSLNLNFSFLNRISLLLISSSYPIVLTRLGGPRSRPNTSEKFPGYSRESNRGPLGWQSDMLTTIPPFNEILKIYFSGQGCLLDSLNIEREKFYPGPGIEPGSPVLCAGTLTTELSRTNTNPWQN